MSNFKKLNSNLKPREKMKTYGIETLSDAEVLSIFLQVFFDNFLKHL